MGRISKTDYVKKRRRAEFLWEKYNVLLPNMQHLYLNAWLNIGLEPKVIAANENVDVFTVRTALNKAIANLETYHKNRNK